MAVHESLDARVSGLAVALGTPELSLTSIGVKAFGGDFAALSYTTLPANLPYTYQNTIYLWKGTAIPWGLPPPSPPYAKLIPTDSQIGTVTMSNIAIAASSYIFGYAVGADPSLICASVILDAGGLVNSAMSVTIGVRFIGTDSVTVRYQVLNGYLPETAGNWIGLWRGRVSPYRSGKIAGSARVPDYTEGTVTIEAPIAIDTTYSLIYYMANPDLTNGNTSAAALLTFNSADPNSPAAHSFIESSFEKGEDYE